MICPSPSSTLFPYTTLFRSDEMPAEDVEQFITVPAERVLDTIKGIESYESTSSPNDSIFIAELANDKAEDITKEIESEINSLANDLHGIKDVTVMQATTDGQYEFFMDISGDNITEMSSFALDVVQPRLESLPEVNDVLISGLEEKEVTITLKPEKLDTYELTREDIIPIIEQTNQNISIGSLDEEKGDPAIRWNTTFKNLDDIKNIPIQTNEGIKRLSDIASVKEEVSEQTTVAWKNGNPDFLLLQIGRANGFTQIDMADAIRGEVKKIKTEHDTSIQINEIAAQADYVSSAIDGVTSNILIGGIIAIIVLLLFLRNIRATFIIGLSIPASVLLTILTMTFLDYSFNMLSLVGLGLGIGMMVDASIVVLESIFKKKEQGFSNIEAVISGTKEVAGAVISSMLTTIVVFVPVVLMDDEIGKMMIVLTVVVAVTLISSVIIAFTLIPVLSESFLKVKKAKKSTLNLIEKYGSIIKWLTKKKRRRIGILTLFIMMFFSSFLLLPKIPMTFMPDILNRYAEVIVEVEPGVSKEELEEIAIAMNEGLEEVPDIDNNVIIDNIDVMLAIINMTPEDDKTLEQEEINDLILEKFRDLEDEYPIKNVGAAMDGAVNPPIELRISGENLATLQDIGTEVIAKLEELDYITSANMQLGEVTDEYVIQLKDDNIEEDGLNAPYLYTYLSQLFADVPVGDVVQDGETTPIFVQSDVTVDDKKELLDNKIMTVNGEKKLSNYLSLEDTNSLGEVNRSNGERYISIIADTEGQDLGTVHKEINDIIQNVNVEQGYSVAVTGDLEEQQQAVQDIIVIFIISLFLVFVVMAIQFNSLKHPFIILFIIPDRKSTRLN